MPGTLYLKSKTQCEIYAKEIKGQLSDGMWENDTFDWGFWGDLEAKVEEGKFGWLADKIPDRMAFDLCSLVEYTGDRMEDIGSLYDEEYTTDKLYDDLEVIEEAMATSIRKIGFID
jgi:hypothetical protein